MAVRLVLFLDTETTGLDPSVCHCIEVAATLFDLELGSAIESYASLIRSTDKNDAFDVNGIDSRLLELSPDPKVVWSSVNRLADYADCFVAHRADFDRSFVAAASPELASRLPWACSKFDMAWPRSRKPGEGLVHLALAHGLGVSHAHRATSDVDTLSRLFARAREMGHDCAKMVELALRPKGHVTALVSYEDRHLAKEAGFEWDADRKIWHRTMIIEEAAKLSFKTRIKEIQA